MIERYQYEPLPETDWIRLLRVLPTSGKHDRLEGELVPIRLIGDMQYEALSYTWGSPQTRDSITVDGKQIHITANCANAIRNLRKPKQTRVLWVDAICINQADTDEKGHEVGMMGEIYSKAIRTIVYLGAGDGTVHLLRACSNLDQGAVGIPLVGGHELEDARRRLLARDWFHRKWIIQETLLSRELIVQCAKYEFTWAELEIIDGKHDIDIINLAKKYLHPSSRSSSVSNTGQDWDPKAKAAYEEMVEQGEIVARNGQTVNTDRYSKYREHRTGFLMPPQLFDMLCATSAFGCKEPRDRVYALLSLFARRLTIKPSYSCSEQEVYDALAKELIGLGDTRMFWIDDRKSWKMNWNTVLSTLADHVAARADKGTINRPPTDIGRLWKEVHQEKRVVPDSIASTSCWKPTGIFLGRINSISPLHFNHDKISPGTMSKGAVEYLPRWKSILDTLGLHPEDHETGASPLAYIHQRNRNSSPWFRAWTLNLFGRPGTDQAEVQNDSKALGRATSAHRGHLAFCKGMTLFLCDGSLIGIAPPTARTNDAVYFLPGTSCPFVVLRDTGEQFELVALCWLGPLKLFPSCFNQTTSMFAREQWKVLEIV